MTSADVIIGTVCTIFGAAAAADGMWLTASFFMLAAFAATYQHPSKEKISEDTED